MSQDCVNRLVHESSPYLLQHAHNPVDWFPWGEEAFEEARRRDVPIFLSVGYSTCYWCHVMERESFEDEGTAERMNAGFVNIKLDREEHPEHDEVYMAATQVLTGRGGWPMSVFLEPASLMPYWAGTYFPREPRDGMPTFTQVLTAMSSAWRENRGEVTAQAEKVASAVANHLGSSRTPVPVGRPQATAAVEGLLRSFDRAHGGFGGGGGGGSGGGPKFPQPSNLVLLLEARATADESTRAAIDAAVRTTLDRMAVGGIRDQLLGSFHRYSVDPTWTVPHFEKMLYDNAQLASVYAAAARVYDDAFYAENARGILDASLAEMTGPAHAGFFSALDAEVEGKEGLNYLWTPEELADILDDEDAKFAMTLFQMEQGPNFRDPHHQDEPARSVLRLADRPERLAEATGHDAASHEARLARVRAAMLEARSRRAQPRLDDKVIASWNGMMIRAMVEGSETLGDPAYARVGARAATHVLERMRDENGELVRVWRDGRSGAPATLEDHAAMISALLALHGSAHTPGDWLESALDLTSRAVRAFRDEDGLWYDTRENRTDMFVRPGATYDGAVPSGSSMMLGAMADLYTITCDPEHLELAMGVLASSSSAIAAHPQSTVNAIAHALRLMRLHPDAASDTRFDFAPPAPPAPVEGAPALRVEASVDEITVSEDRPASLRLRLTVPGGYHLVAADQEGLVPLRVGLTRGEGVAVYADYPDGERFEPGIEGIDAIRVHHGVVEFEVALERSPGVGAGPGEPRLGVTAQLCSASMCLEPLTTELDVDINLA